MELQNCTSTLNFKARFIPKVKINKERWKNIAVIFENKTQQYPNDTLYMTDGGGRFWSTVTEEKNGKNITKKYFSTHYFFSTNKEAVEKDLETTYEWFDSDVIGNLLINYTDSEIASKLVKIFKQCKKAEIYTKKCQILERTCKTEEEFNQKSHNLEQQFYKQRKEYYEKDGALEKGADTYDMFID